MEVALAENFKEALVPRRLSLVHGPGTTREIRLSGHQTLLTPDKNINTESYFRPVRSRRCNT
jgi:hypothetical protein